MTTKQKEFVVVRKCRRISKNIIPMTKPSSFNLARMQLHKIVEKERLEPIQGRYTIINASHPMLK